ncbi:hypothetical protein DXG01_015242 [Tephrocybe rancida]|nr:hypothetical protein DXG01_015242 [Tephrocybe rancida]
MSSVHLVQGRRWLGWYNSPGSYYVAKKYGVLARSKIWDGLYPGIGVDPTTMLELDGNIGPRYVGAHSGTRMNITGHLAYLLMEHCSKSEPTTLNLGKSHLSIIILPESEPKDIICLPPSPFDPIAIVPICVSIGSAVVCAIFGDWYCFAMVMLGVVCNGLSCYVIGSGTLEFKPPGSSQYSPPGDGVLFNSSGSRVMVVKGSERAVTRITRGKFNLRYASATKYHDIGFISLALTTQFLLQLFIIPQGQLFGQIMFLSSLGVSWMFNAYLASMDRRDLQKKILMTAILGNPRLDTVGLPKWTSLVVFAAVCLEATPEATRAILDEMIPNNTKVWERLKATVAEAQGETFVNQPNLDGLNKQEIGLLWDMLEQARIGYEEAKRYTISLRQVSPAQKETV